MISSAPDGIIDVGRPEQFAIAAETVARLWLLIECEDAVHGPGLAWCWGWQGNPMVNDGFRLVSSDAVKSMLRRK